MLNISELAEDLKRDVAMQNTPYPVNDTEYIRLVVQAVKKFFVDVNHPDSYDRTLYITDESQTLFYDYDFDIVQEEYIFILSKMGYKKMVIADLTGDGAISYTTNALSVTGAKEGYKSMQQEIDDLERERIRVFHKMMARDNEG